KQTETHTLMNERARELLDGKFLVRPVGKLQVVGQEQAGMCYEPMCRAADATEEQKRIAAETAAMVDAFVGGCFEQCLKHADELDAAFGPCKLTSVYRGLCEQYLRDGKPEKFDGRIVLTSK